MKIKKVINNNVISAFDEKKHEVVLMGCGIGFKAKHGDVIDEEKIEKIFYIENSALSMQFQKMLSNMPLEHMEISADIISYAKNECKMKLNQSIYVALTDHINFAIERHRQGIVLTNALLGEIRQYYSREYLVGEYALRILAERLNIYFSEDEAGFIALHFVNAIYDTTTHDVYAITDMLQNGLEIVKSEFGEALDTHSMHYERFVAHLKFLVRRIASCEMLEESEEELGEVLRQKYPREYACSKRIKDYIEKRYETKLTEGEELYLLIHIRRCVMKDEKSN
ncbi:BglG family transcription antiterminator LicT [Konateibacter massiliensis]|uniref:BglG family transcription antiterminator LicT n=1 Tax=Konateibacter massiliensis TaxID=2002841 RepID=UPI000C152D1A|nr:PRD domain-containing protein [Konateibacter massiliensis]